LITLISDNKYDPLYLRNYANIRVKDQLARIRGVGQIRMFGGGDYAMRIWLGPDKIASRGMTAGDVVRAIQEQNIQVSAGQLGAEPINGGSDFLIAINAQGRLRTAEEFGEIVLKTGSIGAGRAAFGRRAHRAWRQRTTPAWPARPLQHVDHRRVSGARRQRAGDAGRGGSRRWTSSPGSSRPA